MAFGGLIVPKLNLITSLICKQYFVDEQSKNPYFTFLPIVFGQANDQCRIPGVQAAVSKFTLYGNLIGGILSAISSPKLGAISDRHGRLKVIAFTTCGMFMGEVITIIAATWPDHFSVYWMLLGYVSDGMCGSFLAAMAVAHAYASDCTAPSKRAITFAYFHGCLFTGIAIGPAIAGFVIKASGHLITPFYVALGAHLIFIFCLVVVLPESLTRQRQMAARERRTMINSVVEPTSRPWRRFFLRLLKGGGLFDPLSILWPTGPGSSRAVRRNLISLAAVDTTMFGVAMGSMTVVVIYSDFMFGWGNLEQSVFLTIVNTCRVFVLLVFLPLITRLVRGTSRSEKPNRKSGADHLDLILIRVAIIFDMMGYLGYALATSGDMLKISGAIAAVGGMGSPTLQSALTKHVPADRTGQLLGAMGLLHALARIIAPTIFNFVYAQTVATLPRTVFFCLASAFGVAFVMSWFIRPHGTCTSKC